MLPKPERVDVGQWWLIGPSGTPVRWREMPGNHAWMLLDDGCVYLGSGDHPEPSEEMIEMLAMHAYHVNGGRTDVFPPSVAESYRAIVRRVPLDGPDCVLPERELAIRSLYKILRSLGEW